MDYREIGQAFVAQYYSAFDTDAESRAKLTSLYTPDASFTYEDYEAKGPAEILQILTEKVTFQKIQHVPTKIDCQISGEQSLLIFVMGRLQTDDDPPHAYSQCFNIKMINGSFFIINDLFRLVLHNTM